MPNARYEAFLVAEKGGDYAVSKRTIFKLDHPERISLEEYREIKKNMKKKKINLNEFKYKRFKYRQNIPSKVDMENDSKSFFCTLPFTNMTIRPDSFSFCCHAKSKYLAMPLVSNDIKEIWNSDPIKEARYHMLRGMGRQEICEPNCPFYRDGYWLIDLGSPPENVTGP
jgi:hypothetical protein